MVLGRHGSTEILEQSLTGLPVTLMLVIKGSYDVLGSVRSVGICDLINWDRI